MCPLRISDHKPSSRSMESTHDARPRGLPQVLAEENTHPLGKCSLQSVPWRMASCMDMASQQDPEETSHPGQESADTTTLQSQTRRCRTGVIGPRMQELDEYAYRSKKVLRPDRNEVWLLEMGT